MFFALWNILEIYSLNFRLESLLFIVLFLFTEEMPVAVNNLQFYKFFGSISWNSYYLLLTAWIYVVLRD
jgi:hypothetical protein